VCQRDCGVQRHRPPGPPPLSQRVGPSQCLPPQPTQTPPAPPQPAASRSCSTPFLALWYPWYTLTNTTPPQRPAAPVPLPVPAPAPVPPCYPQGAPWKLRSPPGVPGVCHSRGSAGLWRLVQGPGTPRGGPRRRQRQGRFLGSWGRWVRLRPSSMRGCHVAGPHWAAPGGDGCLRDGGWPLLLPLLLLAKGCWGAVVRGFVVTECSAEDSSACTVVHTVPSHRHDSGSVSLHRA